jgi:xylulokinase
MPVYVGLDCSTQSLSAIAIAVESGRREVVFEHSLNFDEHFSQYGTAFGVLPSADPLMARSSPRMWAEALDRMMQIISAGGVPLSSISAIGGSAQQHGSVYLDETSAATLAELDAAQPLVQQIDRIFSRADAPIWMDASTAPQCDAITAWLGGADAVARLTGSRAFPRFTGPQIRKFAEENPAAYARTATIHLVSSYLASLLAGRQAPIEPGDGAGMNLMDLRAKNWSPAALDATAPNLATKLPRLVPAGTVVGPLAPYWMQRYGFPAARVVAFTGDNPASLLGTGLVGGDRAGMSFGTSDTIFAPLAEPAFDPAGAGHAFGAPMGGFMSLVCCRNGGLARERVRDAYGLDWDGFARALRDTPAGNRGAMLLPWFEPEVTPEVRVPGVRRFDLDPADGPANVRALVEAQMLALAIHSRWTGVRPRALHATGGAAVNRGILQVMADVHDADVYRLAVGNAACLGAALSAYHADQVARGTPIDWEEIVADFAEPLKATRIRPVPEHVSLYREMAIRYAAFEERGA